MIRKNKFYLSFFVAFFFAFTAHAAPYLSLYGSPKYKAGFTNFAYVNPDAPKGGRLVIPEYGGFDNFNPYIFKGAASGTVAELIWDSLAVTPADDVGTVYPLIAKDFVFDAGKETLTISLDPRARFADGSPVTADDVIFSFNVLLEKGAPIYKVYYADVERVEKLSPYQVRFHFRKGAQNKELPLIVTQIKVFSQKDWEGLDFSKPSLRVPLGNGPYRIKDFQAGKFVVLERNPNYWAKDLPSRRGFFNFDEIRIDWYQDTTVTLQALFAGNIDAREEYIAKIWATGYDNELVAKGDVVQKSFEHNEPAILQFFAFNLRRPPFQDKRVRQAINLAFNFDFANEKLFYKQYQRLYSYFTNTGMEATGLPQGLEKRILEKFRSQIDADVFEKPFTLPDHSTPQKVRENLRVAVKLLQEAGYDFVDGKMVFLETKEPLEIEILSNSANGSTFTRVMLPFIANLKKIGIKATFRNLEVNVFKNRMDQFDYDMAIMSYRMSSLPGNELKEMFGSFAADVKGSYNIMGIQNKVVDALIEGIVRAQTRDVYEAYVRALDRVLLSENYLIFQWYSPYHRVGYRNRFGMPKTNLKVGFQPLTWWDKTLEE